jgi:hypothetical protein
MGKEKDKANIAKETDKAEKAKEDDKVKVHCGVGGCHVRFQYCRNKARLRV